VDGRMRGRRVGEALVHASERWFAEHGCREWRVVTQGDNTPACRLYEKCGCSVAGVTFFFHFWL
jgi:ribosomal protein S18 acetylase RimI-like enzyme